MRVSGTALHRVTLKSCTSFNTKAGVPGTVFVFTLEKSTGAWKPLFSHSMLARCDDYAAGDSACAYPCRMAQTTACCPSQSIVKKLYPILVNFWLRIKRGVMAHWNCSHQGTAPLLMPGKISPESAHIVEEDGLRGGRLKDEAKLFAIR
jgi:hypothetical protein